MFPLIRNRPARRERGLTRRLANEPFFALREEMDNLMDRFMEGWNFPAWVEPREVRFEELEKEVVMRVELPGFEAKEIEVRLEGTEVVVRAEHPEVAEKENGHRPAERFEYRLTLPFGTNAAAIEVFYRNGVLEVHFPRRPEAEPRRIEVKV